METRIREWFSPFGKIEGLKVRRKNRDAGEYKSYCLVTYMFRGGKTAALKEGVTVTRTAMSLDDDRVALNLKDVDHKKKTASPLSAAKEMQRIQVLQRAYSIYESYLNPDGGEPHTAAIEGLKALANLCDKAGMLKDAAEYRNKV